MTEKRCLVATGASARGRGSPPRSNPLLRLTLLACGGALLALGGAGPSHADSGAAADTRGAFNLETITGLKFYCNMDAGFQTSPEGVILPELVPACEQKSPTVNQGVAPNLPSSDQIHPVRDGNYEIGVEIPAETFGEVAVFNRGRLLVNGAVAEPPPVAVICETFVPSPLRAPTFRTAPSFSESL